MKRIPLYISILLIIISCDNTTNTIVTDNHETRNMALETIKYSLTSNKINFKIDGNHNVNNLVKIIKNKSSDRKLYYNVTLPIIIKINDGSIFIAHINEAIAISKIEPSTDKKLPITLGNNEKYWAEYFKTPDIKNIKKDTQNTVNKILTEINNQGVSTTNYVSIVKTEQPVHIEVNEWCFETSFEDVIIENNKRAIISIILIAFSFTDLDYIIVTGLPVKINSIKLGKIETAGMQIKYKKTIHANKLSLLNFMRSKNIINEYSDLLYKKDNLEKSIFKDAFNQKARNIMFNDQGGYTLDRLFDHLELSPKQAKLLQSLRTNGADLYEQLLKFKIEKDFINNGFGYSNSLNKYENWSKKVSTLKKECEVELAKLAPHKRIESELFSLCDSATNLNSLARRYATREGQEDKYMKKMRTFLEKEFKTTSNSGKVVLEKIPYSIIKDEFI